MIFLIEYDRLKGEIVRLETFAASEQTQAENARLEVELDLSRSGVEHEVVLLEAATEGALRETHRRYFENAREIGSSLR